MNSIALDILFLRRPRLNYISPPVCEAVFSGTGSPIIILPDINPLFGPTGTALGGSGQIVLRWNNYPGAICYNVYGAVFDETIFTDCTKVIGASLTAQYKLIAECVSGTEFNLTTQGCYRISAITGEGETDLSDPACTACYTPPCPFGSIWNPETFQCEACVFPPTCPPGYTRDEVLCQCVPCGAQNCNSGFVINPGANCNCVPCGSQQCPPGFQIDPLSPCNCRTSQGPFEVCNEEQTAECEDPEDGTPVVVDAGTFCTFVNSSAEIPAAQAAMNAQALAEGQMLLCCYHLDWSTLLWSTPTSTVSGANASASFTPGPGSGASFNAQASIGFAGFETAQILNTGDISYKGDTRTIRIDVSAVATTATPPPSPNAPLGEVAVFFDGNPISSLSIDGGPFNQTVFSTQVSGYGNHTIDFVLPDFCDAPNPFVITIRPAVTAKGAFAQPGAITLTGTVSNH